MTLGISSAQAGTGHLNANGIHCDVTFTTGAATVEGPHSGAGFIGYRDLTNFAPDNSGGKSCAIPNLSGSGHVHWKADGSAELDGSLSFQVSFFTCSYSGTISGMATPTDFTMFPSPQMVSGGGGICPSPLLLENFYGDMTRLEF
jgi:hypothetical protein